MLVNKIKEGLSNIKSNVTFRARLSLLPKLACQSIDQLSTKPFSTLKNPPNLVMTGPLGKFTAVEEKKFNVVGLNIEFDYAKDKSDPNQFKSHIRTSIVITAPKNYVYKVEQKIGNSDYFFKTLFFRSKVADQKHYILINSENLSLDETGVVLENNDNEHEQSENGLKFDIFFTDNVNFDFISPTNINFKAKLDNYRGSLLGYITPNTCNDKINKAPKNDPPRCAFEDGQNINIDHLIIKFKKVRFIVDNDHSNPISISVPFLQAPNHELNEEGGIGFITKFKFIPESKKHFYLNSGDFLTELWDGKNLVNTGLDFAYKNSLETLAGYISLLLSAKNQFTNGLCHIKENAISSALASDNLEIKNTQLLESDVGQLECPNETDVEFTTFDRSLQL